MPRTPFTELQAIVGPEYEIERELGGAGMSRVFVAHEGELNRRVVLKVLPREMAAGVSTERFRREMMTLARLAHPHIVPILRAESVVSADTGAELLYYVMPFQEGESLRTLLQREGRLDVAKAVRLAREIAQALDYAHRQGIIHRDVKPANVLLADGHAMVIDFGVARALSAGTATITGSGITVGTPEYMSPEQASADRELDGRADIYSLGCVLFEMLAGGPPHAAPSAQKVIALKVSTPAPSVTKLRAGLPRPLAAVVKRMLAISPADRFGSARELVLALRDIEARTSGATETTRVGAGHDGGTTRRGWRASQVAMAIVVIAAVALAIYVALSP